MKYAYHSALSKKPYYNNLDDITSFKSEKVIGIKNNLESGEIPKEFLECDFIVAELPWPLGYKKFNERANEIGLGYDNLLYKTVKAIQNTNIPTFVLCHKKFEKQLEGINYIKKEVTLQAHNHKANIFVLNSKDITELDFTTNITLYESLYKKYEIGGDIACGYGLLGVIAGSQNKKVVLADINGKCIDFIKRNHNKWYN